MLFIFLDYFGVSCWVFSTSVSLHDKRDPRLPKPRTSLFPKLHDHCSELAPSQFGCVWALRRLGLVLKNIVVWVEKPKLLIQLQFFRVVKITPLTFLTYWTWTEVSWVKDLLTLISPLRGVCCSILLCLTSSFASGMTTITTRSRCLKKKHNWWGRVGSFDNIVCRDVCVFLKIMQLNGTLLVVLRAKKEYNKNTLVCKIIHRLWCEQFHVRAIFSLLLPHPIRC